MSIEYLTMTKRYLVKWNILYQKIKTPLSSGWCFNLGLIDSLPSFGTSMFTLCMQEPYSEIANAVMWLCRIVGIQCGRSVNMAIKGMINTVGM